MIAWSRAILGALAAAALLTRVCVAEAQPQTSADKIAFAAREHDLGYAAYIAKQFEQAANHFENAFFNAPNAAELRSAIRARRDAKQLARAATLSALGLSMYGDDAATRKVAEQAIEEARPRVFEVRLTCTAECSVAADLKVVSTTKSKSTRFFLEPGAHVLTLSFGPDLTKEINVEGSAGGRQTLSVDPPPPPPAPPAAARGSEGPPPSRKPLAPPVFWVGLALTTVAGGLTIASGVDTKNSPGSAAVRERCVGLGEACAEYQLGRDKQLRTNVLLGVTAGLGATTAILGLFLTRWSSARVRPAAGFDPEGARFHVIGSF